MRRLVRRAAAPAAAAVILAAPVIVRRCRRPRRSDAAVAEAVAGMLRSAYGTRAEDFAVRVRRGSVTMRGEVLTLDEIGMLEARVRMIPGVRDVDNLVRLASGAGSPLPGVWAAPGR